MKKLTKMMMLLSVVITVFTACSKNDEPNGSGGKAKIDNLAITPSNGLTYGDVVTLTGVLSDDAGLSTYNIQISNTGGVIYEETQMLTGKTFNLNKAVVIPFAPNAVAGDLTLALTVKNSGGELTSAELQMKNVSLPNFQKLYLVLNGTAYEMTKNGNSFEYEDFIPAGATGKIYANADKTGIFWGSDDGTNVKVLGTNDLTFGMSDEQYFKISFNPVSFDLTFGDPQTWSPMTGNDLYILGTISGNWRDNQSSDGIMVEQNKMKMSAFSLGNRKMWTWTPPGPEGVPDDETSVEVTMYGNTVAGVFRLKQAGQEQYVLYSNGQIITSAANDLSNNFVLSAAGKFNIRVMADETGFTSVRAFDDDQQKSLEYQNGQILINGATVIPGVGFAGSTLNLVPGNYFVYEGTLGLTNNQSVTGDGIDLSALYCDPDAFTGSGNRTWRFIGPTGQYYVRIDAFSGLAYIKDATGYPSAIYMDGWCWKKFPDDPRSNWNTGTEMTLYRTGTGNVFEGTCYVLPWAGDIKFFAQPSTTDNLSPGGVISAQYFTMDPSQIMTDNIGIKLPVPSDPNGAFYKVSVDLKDGMTTDDTGAYVPVGAKFTYSFTLLP